jgi:glycosyltransferase involved in cell wall biosynthesis
MQKITAAIITYNEERNIERCLLSVKDVADEIVVLDSYSTDKTEDICRRYNVKFLQHEFDGHMEQKNRVKNAAAYDIILSVDADEELSPLLQSSIAEVKKNWQSDAYAFNRLNIFCGRWVRYCGWYPDRKIRLFRKDAGEWGGVNPHDKFILKEGKRCVRLKGDLKHYSFYSIEQHVDQINKFSTIKAQGLHERGKRSTVLRMCFMPWFKCIRGYILKLGFLDGRTGYVICRNSSHAEFLKYAKLWQLNKKNVRK